MKRVIYLGAAAVAAWQLFQAVKGYRTATRKPVKPVPREDINRWENEGGNPIPTPPTPRATAS